MKPFFAKIYIAQKQQTNLKTIKHAQNNMSTPVSNVENVEVVVAQKVARVKKPSLPAKYSKFMSFGFWFLNKMEATVRDQLFPEIKLFSSIEEQSAFFQSYLDEASASNKIMRKTITAFHKPPKVRAEKKSRKTSKPVAAQSDDLIEKLIAEANGDAAAPAPTEEKPKKSKKSKEEGGAPTEEKPKKEKKVADKPKKEKKTKEAAAPVEVVAEPVTDAPAAAATAPVEPLEKPKKEKKTKEVAATTEEKPKKEKKAPAAKKSSKKEETVPEPAAAATQAPADDSDEIQTRIVTIEGGKQFLIDQDYNLYDINTHEEIGKFDPATQQPILA